MFYIIVLKVEIVEQIVQGVESNHIEYWIFLPFF